MATTVEPLVFHPTEHSFTVCGEEGVQEEMFVQYSPVSDFSKPFGTAKYGFQTTANVPYTHLISVDPTAGGPGDLLYWRLQKWNGTNFDAQTTHTVRLRRSRAEQTGWNFVVAGSGRGAIGLNDNSKQFCIPTAVSLGPDFICCPGDLVNAGTEANFRSVRVSLDAFGIDFPVYYSPGNREEEGLQASREDRLSFFPSARLMEDGAQVIRAPNIDPQEVERTFHSGTQGSFYAFGHGNALFIFLNDWYIGGSVASLSDELLGFKVQQEFAEDVLKNFRHKYKWCFMFTHTSVDESDPENNDNLADDLSAVWLLNLHATYEVTAHFSSHYVGWRVRRGTEDPYLSNTLYVNSCFGTTPLQDGDEQWHAEMAIANVRIGVDENGAVNPDKCRIDIVHSGFSDSSGAAQGEIRNTTAVESGVCTAPTVQMRDELDVFRDISNTSRRECLIALGSEWLYSDNSQFNDSVDLLSEQFYNTGFEPIMFDSSLSVSKQKKSFQRGVAPLYAGEVAEPFTDNYIAHDVTAGGAVALNYRTPLPWSDGGTQIDIDSAGGSPTPLYLISKFDISPDISTTELQLIYGIEDAAFIWINGILAWHSDGEGRPIGNPNYSTTNRPVVDPDFVDPTSSSFATNVVIDLEPFASTADTDRFGGINRSLSRRRRPEVNYETGAQPIRIDNIDVIASLKSSNNTIAIMLVQGRDPNFPAGQSTDCVIDIELVALGKNANDLFAPHITAPERGAQFNKGSVTITWDKNDPPSTNVDIATTSVTYDIDYTDNYQGQATNWHSLKKRIPWEQESFVWNVGKMIKSSTIRVRIRARSTETEQVSDWSISGTFSINVFELTAPAIVNPVPGALYSDFIIIVLDETLTKNTYHQKVRYTLEYASRKRNIDFTVIQSNLPVGQNVIRWNIENLSSSNDYVLKLTARNASTCLETPASTPDQIISSFVYGIIIQQSGVFLIDTKPPEAILKIDNASRITNQLEQIVNIFAEDETTQIENVQMRECDADSDLSLGDLEGPTGGCEGEEPCKTIEELLEGDPDFDRLIGKPVSNSALTQWVFEDCSGLKKLEALLTDTGGNMSLQEKVKVFLSVYDATVKINDFIIVIEQRDKVTIDETTSPPLIVIETSIFEVVYLGTVTGQFWVLEPFSRLLYTINGAPSIEKVFEFNNTVYIFTYSISDDEGKIYRNDVSEPTLLNTFTTGLSITTGLALFSDSLFIGFENGELWEYNGLSFVLLKTFSDPINTLFGDHEYLYIGFQNSASIVLYNDTEFITLEMV